MNELLPERLTFNFGVEIYDHSDGQTHVVASIERDAVNVIFQGEIVRNGINVYRQDNYEILGTPLSLADVLRAIGMKENYALDTEIGSLLIEEHDFKYKPTGITLDLSLHISAQPDPTLIDLLELLK